MKKIKNKRSFATAVITSILAVICFAIFFVNAERRFLVSALLLLVFSISNYATTFSHKGILEELRENTDERDQYITMKSGHMAIQILNYTMCAGCFASLVLYAAVKSIIFLTVGITLCAVLVGLFLIMLCVNSYYEKHL